ncbi:nuclear transport factor 2 family protein [Micromonospora sp. PLK6-60]|uniref:nuclear transport factor 2 family protein n=1 Tax=Micromonospora sp. PLK6-60 TaxID=2873383 RepID=UPI001CA77D85|nr:nuclear transport factor 2 family protein [Micromonospora sp. PLK6-60]MBY8873129.1 nuclear transport factor 2 family protein [Micromonospora sp. PLK6-60]
MDREKPPEHRQLLDQLYAAFNRRDLPTLLSALAPDVSWPNGWEGGIVHGRQQVRDYWTRQWAEIDPVVRPVAFDVEADGRLNVTVHQVVRDRAGAVIADGEVRHVYRFVDGLVAEMEIRS